MNYTKVKKIIAFSLILIMSFSLSVTSFASEQEETVEENVEEVEIIEEEPEVIENDPQKEEQKEEKPENPVVEEKSEVVESKDTVETELPPTSSSETPEEHESEQITQTPILPEQSEEIPEQEVTTEVDDKKDSEIIEPNETESSEEITTEEFTEELTTEEETQTKEDLSKVFSDTQIMTFDGYVVSITGTSGTDSLYVTEIENNLVRLSANYFSDYYTWDGWYINGEKITSEKEYIYEITLDTVIEARAAKKNISYKFYLYSDASDTALLDITKTPNIWIEQGTYEAPENMINEFIKRNFRKDNDFTIEDSLFENTTIQQFFLNNGLNYQNYQYRFVYAEDGIHLDAVLKGLKYPDIPSGVYEAIAPIEERGPISFAVDGIFTEWIDYPHIVLSYSGGNDAYSCLYSGSKDALFNVYTEMPAHLAEGGGEFTAGVTVLINDNWGYAFYPRFISADSAGNINWDPQLVNLPKGTHHFYLTSRDAWHVSPNLKELHEMDLVYGDAYIKISDNRDEIEWRLDMNMVANKLNISPSEIKTIKVSYSRLGPQWTIGAGTPTGLAGILACISLVGIGMFLYKKRK